MSVRPIFQNPTELNMAVQRFLREGNPDNYDTIGTWDVSNIRLFHYLFRDLITSDEDNARLEGIGNWDVRNGSMFVGMFEGCSHFNQPLGNWTISPRVMSMNNMFRSCGRFNQPLADWNLNTTSTHLRLRSIDYMFWECSSFNQNLHNWNLTGTSHIGAFVGTGLAGNEQLLPIGVEVEEQIHVPRAVPVPRARTILAMRIEAMEVHKAAGDIKEEMMIEASEYLKDPTDTCNLPTNDFHNFIINTLMTLISSLPAGRFKQEAEQALAVIEQRLNLATCELPRYKLCFIYYILKYLLDHLTIIPPDQLRIYLQGALIDSKVAYESGDASCLGGMYERIFLSFIQLAQFSPELVANNERLKEVVEIFDIPTKENLSLRLKECLDNFAKGFKGKRDFHFTQYMFDLRTRPTQADINTWIRQCLQTAYPRPSHQPSIDEFMRENMGVVYDMVSDVFWKYNVTRVMKECLETYVMEHPEIPTWDSVKERVKNCLLAFFGEEDAETIQYFVSKNKDDLMEQIGALVDRTTNSRSATEKEEEEEKEEGLIGGRRKGKRRTKKPLKKSFYKSARNIKTNKNKKKRTRHPRKTVKRKVARKRHTRR